MFVVVIWRSFKRFIILSRHMNMSFIDVTSDPKASLPLQNHSSVDMGYVSSDCNEDQDFWSQLPNCTDADLLTKNPPKLRRSSRLRKNIESSTMSTPCAPPYSSQNSAPGSLETSQPYLNPMQMDPYGLAPNGPLHMNSSDVCTPAFMYVQPIRKTYAQPLDQTIPSFGREVERMSSLDDDDDDDDNWSSESLYSDSETTLSRRTQSSTGRSLRSCGRVGYRRSSQRHAANQRERKRMKTINDAFEVLREKVPIAGTGDRKLSKVSSNNTS